MASPTADIVGDDDDREELDVREQKSSSTVKRKLDAELTKKELTEILVTMEGELQAREIAFAALKAEKSGGSFQKFRYGCLPALQRDSMHVADDRSEWESAMKSIYARQMALLDNLVQTQHKTQHRTRAQLAALERQYHKACAELEKERQARKSESTVEAAGSLKNLEEERNKLQKELEEERERNAKLECDLKLLGELLSAAKVEANKHRQGAVVLAKERRWFAEKISKMAAIIEHLEESLQKERAKSLLLSEQFAHVEAQLKSQSEQRTRETTDELNQRSLQEKDEKIVELCAEISRLKTQLEDLQTIGTASTPSDSESVSVSCSVTLPFPLNPAADTVDSVDSAVRTDIVNVTLLLPSSQIPAATASLTIDSFAKPPMHTLDSASRRTVMSISQAALLQSSYATIASSIVGDDRAQTRLVGSLPKSGAMATGVGRGSTGGHSRIPHLLSASRPSSGSSKPNQALKTDSRSPETLTADWQISSVSEQPIQSSKLEEAGANFDMFSQEMANLQQLLVSMASGEKAKNAEQATESGGDHLLHLGQSKEVLISPASVGRVPDSVLSSIHSAILAMDHISLARLLTSYRPDLNEPISNGVLPLHVAAESGCEECVRVLLDHGADPNVVRDDHGTALHVASVEGHTRCLQILLEYGGCVSMADHSGWTPLHCAASNGHSECCHILLDHGARIDAVTSANWTPLHCCIHSGHSGCLEAILTHQRSNPSHTGDQILDTLVEDVVNMVDKDGWTIAHLATVRESKDCLEVLSRHVHLNLERRDKWNRSVLDVASVACRQFLQEIGSRQEVACLVSVELVSPLSAEAKASPKRSSVLDQSTVTVGSVVVSKGMTWMELEEKLGSVFLNHTSEVSIGLRTKKTSRLDQDSPDAPNPFTLGISLNSVKYYSIARYHWSPGTSTEKSPFEMLAGFNTNTIIIKLFGLDDNCNDSLSYEMLIPGSVLQNYLRLIEQYRSVVFYGPKGTGKTFLARKLAKCIQMNENRQGNTCEVTFFTLSAVFSRKDLVKLLLDKGCLINSSSPSPPANTPILILDDLAKISVVEVFKDILPAMETRGPTNQVLIRHDGSLEPMYCYMNPCCYIIGTMDRARSTGLELSIQQRFKWVHLRCDQEPIKYLLHRHLLRRLAHSYRGCIPLPDNSIYKAAEWVICVWQRLNEGLTKLGLLDLVFGPCYFLVCPIEANKPKAILRWLSMQWNQVIAPTITDAVIRGSGSDIGGGGQQKVVSTALYVLMQRAIVSGCPLSGLEKERYFAGFQGSNELDIKIRGEKRDPKSGSTPVGLHSARDGALEHSDADTSSRSGFYSEDEGRVATIRKADPDLHGKTAVSKELPGSFTNTSLFAVSGIPTRPHVGQTSSSNGNLPQNTGGKSLSVFDRRSPLPVTGNNSYSVNSLSSTAGANLRFMVPDPNPTNSLSLGPQHSPIIVHQPVRSITPGSARPLNDFSKRTTSDVVLGPQEPDRINSSGGSHWRRALSPGPEFMHTREVKIEENVGRSGSPGPELLQTRLWRNEGVHGGNFPRERSAIRFPMSSPSGSLTLGSDSVNRRIDFRVVNPTKVLPIDVASMSLRDVPK